MTSASTSTPTQAPPTLLQQAKAGDPKAITALLNQHLGTQGITARAIRQGQSLKITLAAPALPPETQLAPPLKQALCQLAPATVTSISFYGCQTGFSRPLWTHSFALTPPTAPAPVPDPESASQLPSSPSDPLQMLLADLSPATLATLAHHLQVSPSQVSIVAIQTQIQHWQQRAQQPSTADPEAQETDLMSMALSLRILQLTRLPPEDLMLLIAGL